VHPGPKVHGTAATILAASFLFSQPVQPPGPLVGPRRILANKKKELTPVPYHAMLLFVDKDGNWILWDPSPKYVRETKTSPAYCLRIFFEIP